MGRQVLAVLVGLVFSSACGGQSASTGPDDEPSAGKGGKTENGGSPNGGSTNGGSTNGGVSGGGTANGGVSGGGAECLSAEDCPNFDTACTTCSDGSTVCPTFECVRGTCLLVSVVCPECRENADCPVPPLACTTCADGTTSCPTNECYKGECSTGWSGGCAGVTPCANLECGALCNPCTLPMCPPRDTPYFCNAKGDCAREPAGCFGTCRTTTDCPPPPPSCGDCPSDTCLAVACVNGACELVCR